MTQLVTTDADAEWIPADPFRSYVRHLLEAAELPWTALAVLSDVPAAQLRSLLFGRRGGRPLRRLHPHTAARLLSLNASQLRMLRYSRCAAGATRELLGNLAAHGLANAELARAAELSRSELSLILSGSTTDITHRVAVLVEAQALLVLPPHLRRHVCDDDLLAAA